MLLRKPSLKSEVDNTDEWEENTDSTLNIEATACR